jgi:hypothetical protein
MLKFAGCFQVGDKIRAYDFKPSPDRDNRWVEGVVLKTCVRVQGADCYEIAATRDSHYYRGVGDRIIVPHQVAIMEYDDRIQLVEKEETYA